MKKLFLLAILFLITSESVNAGIITNFFDSYNSDYYYNNGYRYQRKYRPEPFSRNNYRKRNSYYYPPYNYYNQQPVIYRTRVKKKSCIQTNEKKVAVTLSGIKGIEKKILNKTFESDSLKNRIERLEQKIFGTIQNGTLEERFDVLQSASKNYKMYNPDYTSQSNAYTNSYRPPIFSGSTGSSWKNTMLGNFRNQLIGTPTGFTPAMDPAYMDYFEAERAMKDYSTNQNRNYSNTTTGTGGGVTILD